MISEAELKALSLLADAATEGPWSSTDNGCVTAKAALNANPSAYVVASVGWLGTRTPTDADARFIAAARRVVPSLLADVWELKEQLARMTRERDAYRSVARQIQDVAQRVREIDAR